MDDASADAALLDAIEASDVSAAAAALARGANANAFTPPKQSAYWNGPSPWRRSPLLVVAAAAGAAELVHRLIAAGADVDAEVLEQWRGGGEPLDGTWLARGSALLFAAEQGHFDVVEALLQHGAQAHVQAALCSAIDKRVHDYHPESSGEKLRVARLLLERGAKPDGDALLSSIWAGRHDMVRLLLESGADPDVPNRYGAVALHNAMRKGDIELCRLLIESGATVPPPAGLRALRKAVSPASAAGPELVERFDDAVNAVCKALGLPMTQAEARRAARAAAATATATPKRERTREQTREQQSRKRKRTRDVQR